MNQEQLWEHLFDLKCKNSDYPRALATLSKDIPVYESNNDEDEDEDGGMKVGRVIKAGTRVNVVMASRFGDLGITDDLKAEQGYDARVQSVEGEFMGHQIEPNECLTDIVVVPRRNP